MLNLSKPYNLLVKERQYLNAFLLSMKDKSGPELWEVKNEGLRKIKHRISVYTLAKQECRCAYCESFILGKGKAHIEHIAPKKLYKEFTFDTENLVTACDVCNGLALKGDKDTIIIKGDPYRKSLFKIVHPYIDDTDKHIVFKNESRTTFDKVKCTPLGLSTIDFFEWDSDIARKSRLKECSFRKEHPEEFTKIEIAKVIRKISSYKK